MKQLALFVVLLLVLGLGGFLYRYTMEQPNQPEGPTACTTEARICPDGSSVGRTGPDCNFAKCEYPNIELPQGIVFATPKGYSHEEFTYPGLDVPLVRLAKPTTSEDVFHRITVDVYEIPAGQTADQVILANTRYEPSDMTATDFSRFETVSIGGKQFRSTVIERFEGVVQSSYFLARGSDVLRFDIVEQGVDWTNPDLVVRNLPEHQALERMLETLQTN